VKKVVHIIAIVDKGYAFPDKTLTTIDFPSLVEQMDKLF
jgi:hypothetical protein